MQADPPPQPAPPGIDIGGLASAIGQAFQTVLSSWATDLPKRFADGLRADIAAAWDGLWNSGANIFATPPEWTVAFEPGLRLGVGLDVVVYGIVVLAIVLLALRNLLRTITGGNGTLDEAVNGVLLGIMLAGSSYSLMRLAFQATRLASDAFGRFSYAPSMTSPQGPSIALGILTLVVIFIYSFRLWIRAAYRLVLLMFLAPFAAVAGALYAIPQTRWIGTLYFATMGGWLAGGFLALGAISLGVQLATIGNTNGIISLVFGIGLVQLAYDLMGILPKAFTGGFGGGASGFRAVFGGGGGGAAGSAGAAAAGGAVGGAAVAGALPAGDQSGYGY